MTIRFLAFCLLLLAEVLCCADNYTRLCQEAAECSRRQDYEEAIQKYQAALAIRPGAAEASNNLAVMFYQVRRYSDALRMTSVLWRTHPELKSAALIAGMSAVQCNRASEAIEPLHAVLQTDPRNRDALLTLASALFALKQLPQAAEVYGRELQTTPEDAQAWYGAAICYESMAEEASRKLATMPGGLAYSKRLLTDYLQGLGDARLAAEAFGDTVQNEGASPDASRQYENTRALAEQSRNAFEHFVGLAPDSWQAALFLGDVDRQHGDLTGAIAHYRAAAGQQPNNAAPLLGLGTAYWELGDFEQANAYLERTLRLKPDSRQAEFELANIAVRQHRDQDAIPLLQKYLAEQPNALAARADLGRAYFHLKDFASAARELARARQIDTDGDIHYQLSISLRKLGRIAEADATLKQSVLIRQQQSERSRRLHGNS